MELKFPVNNQREIILISISLYIPEDPIIHHLTRYGARCLSISIHCSNIKDPNHCDPNKMKRNRQVKAHVLEQNCCTFTHHCMTCVIQIGYFHTLNLPSPGVVTATSTPIFVLLCGLFV